MILPTVVQQLIQESSGINVRQPKAIEALSESILQKTGDRIGETTLRRLYGFVDDEREPRSYTLDIIARFLDYGNWECMMKDLCPADSIFIESGQDCVLANLKEGSMLEIKYFPDRVLQFEALGDHRFKVTESLNSKLKTGDIAIIDDMLLHFPLHARSVVRDGVDMGRYIAGEKYGICSIRII